MNKYFHCHLIVEGENNYGYYLNDLTYEKLFEDIIKPYILKKQFIFDGYMISPDNIKRLKIVETDQPSKHYIDIHYQRKRAAGIVDMRTISKSIVIANGKDITNDIMKDSEIIIQKQSPSPEEVQSIDCDNKNNVFIVYGHDTGSMHELFRVLKDDFKLNPIVLNEEPNIGFETIISKFDRLAQECSIAVVLMTPDDVFEEGETKRARQNVIFELGYFLGLFNTPTKRKIIIFYKEGVEIPSDISGVLYYKFHESITEVFYQMKKQFEIWGH